MVILACRTTKKVPDGEYLLTKNNFEYDGEKLFADEVPSYVSQKPNKKQVLFLPLGLWMYNAASAKYDSILNEYATFPSEMRNQKLRDSLFIKYKHPEYIGKSLFYQRQLHNLGQEPVILDQAKSESSAEGIRKYLVYKGYWDAETKFNHDLDSAKKKAEVTYHITPKDATHIDGYYYDISDSSVKEIYEKDIRKSFIRNKQILDQTVLEKEVRRINDLMKEGGYYEFNADNDQVYFTADTLTNRKQVPLTLEIRKDSINTPFKKTTVDSIKVFIVENAADARFMKKPDTTFLGIHFYEKIKDYKVNAIWRGIISRPKEIYNQKNLDQTKRNLVAMNNFNLTSDVVPRENNDSIIDLRYILTPLPKYEFKVSTDLNYSQLLNLGISPSIDLTTRNIFGGAENLTTSLSGTFGSVKSTKNLDKRVLAYEISAQAALSFPKLLLPFTYYKLIPKRYSPTSSITLGTSIQDNIGLGRIGFNAGLNYFADVNGIISHRLSLFNTQFSLTRNKEKYYDYFSGEREVVDIIHEEYFNQYPDVRNQLQSGEITFDDVSRFALENQDFITNYASASSENLNTYYGFMQSLLNKERQTQDVLISSMVYNFIYNEIGKKDRPNPFFFNGKVELAGNMLGIFSKKETTGLTSGNTKTIFGIPYSQFVKFDFDVRKYFNLYRNHNLVLRQFVGLGIPYGNSSTMPFVRSYFNGGSNDIRAWRVFGGLGPADLQTDPKVRSYIMDNVKLTTNIEYRMPLSSMFEGALFVDAGNIWSLKDSGFGDQFKFNKFINQMGVGTGFGIRMNVAYITVRIDAAYKVHDPNLPQGDRWVIGKWQPLKPVLNFAFGYPF